MAIPRFPVLLFGAVLVSGCATDAPDSAGQSVSASASSASRNCTFDKRTGTNLSNKECAAAMTDAERQQAVENMRARNPITSTLCASGGG